MASPETPVSAPTSSTPPLIEPALASLGIAPVISFRPTPEQIKHRATHARFARIHIGKSDLRLEAGLFLTKWFAYRYMSPWEATEQFLQEYVTAYRAKFRQYYDAKSAPKRGGVTSTELDKLKPRSRTAIWRARMAADAAGLPYDVFITQLLEKAAMSGAKHLPRPNQLLNQKRIAKITEDWHRKLADAPNLLVKNPEYRLENYVGDSAQDAHREWVVKVIRRKASSPIPIAKVCFHQRQLSVEQAVAEFGHERLENAKQWVEEKHIAEHERVYPVPSCFAMEGAINVEVNPCARCALVDQCGQAADSISKILMISRGTSDPVGDRKRRLVRDRKRRQRERDRQGIVARTKRRTAPLTRSALKIRLARDVAKLLAYKQDDEVELYRGEGAASSEAALFHSEGYLFVTEAASKNM